MKSERVTEEKIHVAIRANGIANIKNVEVVLLQADGFYNVVPFAETVGVSSLNGVAGYSE